MGALAEMYVQGVSKRKVTAITEELCGYEFSAATVSRINESLDGESAKFAARRLENNSVEAIGSTDPQCTGTAPEIA